MMAEHIHKSYSCDRCKADLGETRPSRPQPPSIFASFRWETGPGPSFKWVDLCDPCYRAVRAFFLPEGLRPPKEVREQSRQDMSDLLEAANTNMVDYVLARMITMNNGWRPGGSDGPK